MFAPSKLLSDQLASLAQGLGGGNTPPKMVNAAGGLDTGYQQGAATYTPPKITSFGDPNAASGYDPFTTLGGTGAPGKLGSPTLMAMFPGASGGSDTGLPNLPAMPGSSGTAGQFAGDLSVLNQYDSAFSAAGRATGLDPNLIKSIAAEEGGWGAGAVSGAGAVGIMQVVPGGYAALEAQYPNWQTDPTQNIMLGAAILKQKIAENGGDTAGGVRGYLGSGVDPFTGISTDQYWNAVNGYWHQLAGSTSGAGTGIAGGGTANGSTGFSAITGGAFSPISQEYGITDFSQSSGDYYGFGAEYTTNGQMMGHTGVDVGVTRGTKLYSPVSGVVMIAGGSPYYYDENAGPNAPGSGELMIQMANGDEVILGHMSNIQVGQTVQAGQFVGLSGGDNGDHVHIEYRKKVAQCTGGYDGSCTSSGWLLVDPRQALGGRFSGTTGAQASAPAGGYTAGSYAQQLTNFAQTWQGNH